MLERISNWVVLVFEDRSSDSLLGPGKSTSHSCRPLAVESNWCLNSEVGERHLLIRPHRGRTSETVHAIIAAAILRPVSCPRRGSRSETAESRNG